MMTNAPIYIVICAALVLAAQAHLCYDCYFVPTIRGLENKGIHDCIHLEEKFEKIDTCDSKGQPCYVEHGNVTEGVFIERGCLTHGHQCKVGEFTTSMPHVGGAVAVQNCCYEDNCNDDKHSRGLGLENNQCYDCFYVPTGEGVEDKGIHSCVKMEEGIETCNSQGKECYTEHGEVKDGPFIFRGCLPPENRTCELGTVKKNLGLVNVAEAYAVRKCCSDNLCNADPHAMQHQGDVDVGQFEDDGTSGAGDTGRSVLSSLSILLTLVVVTEIL